MSNPNRTTSPPATFFAGFLVLAAASFYILLQNSLELNTTLDTTLVARYKIVGELVDLQRAVLRAQVEIDQWLLDPDYDLNEIVNRYAIVKKQADTLIAYADLPAQKALFNAESDPLLQEMQTQILASGSLAASLESPATPQQRLADMTQLKTTLAAMDLTIKQLYDIQDIATSADLGVVSRQARDSRNSTAAVGALMAAMSVGMWLITRRISHT